MQRTQPNVHNFTARQNVLQKLRKLALRKHMMSSLLTLNQTQQYFILVQ